VRAARQQQREAQLMQGQRVQRQQQRAERLSAERQAQLIQAERQRQEVEAQRRAEQLQQSRRLAQYRAQQRYYDRLREQRVLASRAYDYDNDPYYYTAPTYRYSRSGRVYETNRYGADVLRRAVNLGYEEGVRAGQADREDGWRGDYRSSYAYGNANYGYDGRYVSQGDYNYYFREGFRRGYEDGFNSQSRYGTAGNGTFGILANVLSTILNLRELR
jgi:hypothetical protein